MNALHATRLVLYGLLLACPAQAASPTTGAPAGDRVMEQYYRNGAGFACVSASADPKSQPCNHIGALHTGRPAATLDRQLGSPAKVLVRVDGGEDRLYPFGAKGYIAATVAKGTIVALQATGPGPLPDWTFSGIGLGTSAADLSKRFGSPMKSERIPPSGNRLWRNGAEQWSYAPWSFSFEIADGKVISIRVGID